MPLPQTVTSCDRGPPRDRGWLRDLPCSDHSDHSDLWGQVSCRAATLWRMPEVRRAELARQVVVGLAAGVTASYAGPVAGAVASGAAPAVLVGLDFISATIGARRLEHAAETLGDAADETGAKTPEEFIEFVKAAVRDERHQELLARALTIAQDTAMRDKRRALGRVLASAADETGTKVDDEMLFIRVLADLDPPHIRCLRIMATQPPQLDAINRQRLAVGEPAVRQWHPSDIAGQDPGLKETVWALLPVLARNHLITGGHEVITWAGREPEYVITPYGEHMLARLAEPAPSSEETPSVAGLGTMTIGTSAQVPYRRIGSRADR